MGFNIFGKKEPIEYYHKGKELYEKKKYSKAIDALLKVQDLLEARYLIGMCELFLGLEYPERVDEYRDAATKWFYYAAQEGHPESTYQYAICLIRQKNDQEEGIKWLQLACDLDVGEAYQRLGMIYVERGDLQTAATYFKKGADLGDSMCVYNYGVYLLESGHKKESFEWFKRGVDMGEWHCYNNYAALLSGYGRKNEAIKYYKMAADRGEAKSMYSLYWLQSDDLISSTAWLKKSASLGYEPAIADLALKDFKKSKDVKTAIETVSPHAEKGNADCCAALMAILINAGDAAGAERVKALFDAKTADNLYRIGCDLWQLGDVPHALHYLSDAAYRGKAAACSKLSNYYYYHKDYRNQKKWIEQGIALKDLISIHNMGVYYLSEAESHNPDATEEAIRYLLISLKGGYMPSARALKYAIREKQYDTVKGMIINTTRSIVFQSLAFNLLGVEEAAEIGVWVDHKLTAILGSVEDTIAKAEQLLADQQTPHTTH